MMKTQDLSTLVAVVEQGSVTGAAQRLNLTHSAVSQRLKQLELQLSTSLLNRQVTPVQPTEAGERVIKHAREVLHLELELLTDLRHKRQRPLRLSCTPAFGACFLSAALSEFSQCCSHSVAFDYQSGESILKGLHQGLYDIAIVEHLEPLAETDWAQPLPPDQVAFVGSPERLARLQDGDISSLSSQPLFVAKSGCCSRDLLCKNLATLGLNLDHFQALTSCGDLHFMERALLDGAGIGFVSTALVKSHLKAGRLDVLELPEFTHRCYRSMVASVSAVEQPWFAAMVKSIESAFYTSANQI